MAATKSPAAKRTAPPTRKPPVVVLEPGDRGVWVAVRESRLYRFLMSDGTVLDVLATGDDSDLRAAVLAHTKADQIMGVVKVP